MNDVLAGLVWPDGPPPVHEESWAKEIQALRKSVTAHDPWVGPRGSEEETRDDIAEVRSRLLIELKPVLEQIRRMRTLNALHDAVCDRRDAQPNAIPQDDADLLQTRRDREWNRLSELLNEHNSTGRLFVLASNVLRDLRG